MKFERLDQEKEEAKVGKKISEELEETRATDIKLKTQVKEARRIEEVLKDQLDEKERTCQKLEMEVVDLRKKDEKNDVHAKFKNSSTILGEILDCQRSPFDKTGLGYNKEIEESEAELNPSSSRVESKTSLRYLHKTKKISEQKDIKELAPLLQIDS